MCRLRVEFGSARTAVWQAGLERGARAAEQAVDRGLTGLEHLGDLPSAQAEHIAQHEHGALLRRDVLKAGD